MPSPGLPPWDIFDGGFAPVTAGQLNDTVATWTITVSTGQGVLFMAPILGYPVDIWDAGSFPFAQADSNHEIAFVTSHTGDSFDITRNFLGTIAKDHTGAVNLVIERNLKAIELPSLPIPTTGTPATQELRLSLVTGVPVPPDTGILTGSHLFFTPYNGTRIGLWDGTNNVWVIASTAEIDQDFTTIDGIAGAGVYDIFAKLNPAPFVSILSIPWASNNARTALLDVQDGILIAPGDATKRYVGTVYWDGSLLSYSPSDRNVWNYNNRVAQTIQANVSSIPYTATSSSWADTSAGGQFVVGLVEDTIALYGMAWAQGDAGSSDYCDVGAGLASIGLPGATAGTIAAASLSFANVQGLLSSTDTGYNKVALFVRSRDNVHTVTLDDAYVGAQSNTVYGTLWG